MVQQSRLTALLVPVPDSERELCGSPGSGTRPASEEIPVHRTPKSPVRSHFDGEQRSTGGSLHEVHFSMVQARAPSTVYRRRSFHADANDSVVLYFTHNWS